LGSNGGKPLSKEYNVQPACQISDCFEYSLLEMVSGARYPINIIEINIDGIINKYGVDI
jgi:hypothetical protein